MSGYSTGHLTFATLISLLVGTGLGVAAVLIYTQVWLHLTPLTTAQKRGVDMIDVATGWEWIDHMSPYQVMYRLKLDDDIVDFGRMIAGTPDERKAFTPAWWQPWMQSKSPLMGRLDAMRNLTGWIARADSEKEKARILDMIRDFVNISLSKFWPTILTFAQMSERQREAIQANGFLPMPENETARALLMLIPDMNDHQLKNAQKALQRIVKER